MGLWKGFGVLAWIGWVYICGQLELRRMESWVCLVLIVSVRFLIDGTRFERCDCGSFWRVYDCLGISLQIWRSILFRPVVILKIWSSGEEGGDYSCFIGDCLSFNIKMCAQSDA